MNVQEISVNGHDCGYAWPFNLRGLDWRIRYLEWTRKILHRRIDTASVAVTGDAIDAALPAEELSLPRTSTLFPKDASTLNTWSMVTQEVAGDPCIFILYCPRSRTDTILVECVSPDEIQKLCARSLHLTRSPQGDSSTSRALINFNIDLVIVPEEVIDLYRQIEYWDKIQKLCVIINNVGNNRVSPLTMQRLNQLSTPRKVVTACSWNSEHAQYPLHEVGLRRYAQAIQKFLALRKTFPHIDRVLVEPHDGEFFGCWCGPTQRVSILLSVLMKLALVAAALAILCLF
ncbi:hypothetical protein BCIN_06g02230 [Botrytis cinerea B05.10]|uniref:Uncharacterized protein n=1 Tax=Botryotinia fuckeliana (strain B05.10) TaxID=332648 RepID=A0A384JJH3_BOTFB|nr:hypothetical protein BCIN_06g02230 [Botrytis cinerea B05.10]ATZ50735.1 hypothetical protein BCIN_06g02230 [Botrytis cinerea B05.10]